MCEPGESKPGSGNERPMRIRVLFFDGCPNSQPTFDLVRRIAAVQEPDAVIERIEVGSEQEAARLRFLGSPTVRINGVDIEPASRQRINFAMVCRLYGESGVPTAELITAAIREAAG